MEYNQPTDQGSKPEAKDTFKSGRTRYGKEFEIHLKAHNIYMDDGKSIPLNLEELRAKLREGIASSSPAQFSQEQFLAFKEKNDAAVFASDIVANVFPDMCGNSSILSRGNVIFTELAPITNNNVPRPQPKAFDGQCLSDLSMEIRHNHEIRQRIIPSKHTDAPVAMNFFMEAKGSEALVMTAKRQACYYGAYGARAMNCLQNYGKAQPEYDGNAYTFTSIYFSNTGLLHLYAHHVIGPCQPGGREEYHMTLVDAWLISNHLAGFQSGITAFRNARELAQEFRVRFIQAANARHGV
ncbi:hypothetical protein E4U21_005656 [Claviceps maximensis]|nr:hypothetical protein E4U21_005656 [Claviceps maximensis]